MARIEDICLLAVLLIGGVVSVFTSEQGKTKYSSQESRITVL